jgi:hypothetical protein
MLTTMTTADGVTRGPGAEGPELAQPGRGGRQPVGPLTDVLPPFCNILRKGDVA